MSWSIVLAHSLFFAMGLSVVLRLNKELRGKRGALAKFLSFDDVLCILLVAFLHTLATYLLPAYVSVIVSMLLFFYGLLVFIDAMLFVQYRIEVNRQTLIWFFKGSKGLQKGIPHLLGVFKKFPIGISIPFLMIACIVLAHIEFHYQWLLSVSGGALLDEFGNLIGLVGTAVIALVIVWLKLAIRKQSNPSAFFSTPTLLTNILADDKFTANERVSVLDIHQTFIDPPAEIPKPSELHGVCKGANIILITLESLGAYVSPYSQNGARSKLAERLKSKSWVSKKHYCLCPNTTVSTNQIYSGGYSNNPYNKEDSLYPGTEPRHIKRLNEQGYKTLFLDSADISLYDYHKLLTRIGFDRVWGTKDLPSNGLTADYRLWNMVDVIAEEVNDSPFFLHLINDQTHMPYQVVDKKRFNSHRGNSQKDLYLNAVEEVDHIFDTFLQKLGQKIDLSNTVIVFTGDHGESFGEFGYSFHSNSVILPQMQVPFMLYHPKLGAKEIEHSCHFDLFPTFFDLLGITFDYPTLGNSIAKRERDFAYFFHSATLKGNTPANFGFMLDGEMLWMDRLFNQVNVLGKAQHSSQRSQYGDEYIKTLLFKMLKTRDILS